MKNKIKYHKKELEIDEFKMLNLTEKYIDLIDKKIKKMINSC
jgi:hypothetical protein